VFFVPTGGIDLANLESYLALPFVPAIGGTWMVKEDIIASGDYRTVTTMCAEAVLKVAEIREKGK